MINGRTEELNELNEIYNSESSSVVMVYGRSNIGKTTLIKEFIKDKNAFYYSAALASEKQQIEFMKNEFLNYGIVSEADETDVDIDLPEHDNYAEYAHLFKNTSKLPGKKKLIVIEEFQNIVKNNKEFMTVIVDLVKAKFYNEKAMVIVTSSSISWVENSMVSVIGENALAIETFIKLKELSFVDIVRMFPRHSVLDATVIYAITGGVPGYLSLFSEKLPLRENIINNVLSPKSKLRYEGGEYIKEELRETSLYNTILYCLANGENKLNELHAHTGFGRDKISVYIKNLIEREIVEKVYSYDIGGKEYTKKGLYNIKSGYTAFWFKFIYANESQLNILGEEQFYDKYIASNIYAFAKEAFVKVGTEFIEILDSMGRLDIKINRRGRWWGKNGDIDIVACDTEGTHLVGKCNWDTDTFSFDIYEELLTNIDQAGIVGDYVYLFSRDKFDEKLRDLARVNSAVKLVSLKDL